MSDAVLHTARPTPLAALLNPARMIGGLWMRRDLIAQFARRYFSQRYRGTHLGAVWAIVYPLLSLLIFTFVFGTVLSARYRVMGDEPRSHYAVLLFTSMTVFAVFVESVVRSTSLVADNPSYVKKVVFPLEVLPVAQAAASVMFGCIGIVLALIATWIVYGRIPWTAALFPAVLLPMLPLALGLAWFFSSLCVFVRDVANVVGIVISSLLIFLTPVFFSIDHLPERWRPLAHLNPLAPIIDGARKTLVLGEQPDWPALAVVLVVGLAVAQLGYAWFMKSKRGFADVL
ncbi:MAG: transport permease protein [Phycisphaerae bacterium]|nr:MAG: transport permease protein [Phycisphaerae bacterium]